MSSEWDEGSPPLVTTIALHTAELRIFLTHHAQCPEQASHEWALPCTVVQSTETIDLQCLTDAGIAVETIQSIERLGIFWHEGKTQLAFLAFVKAETTIERGVWWSLTELPGLRCGHHDIIAYATNHLRRKLAVAQNLLTLLPECFTLQKVREMLQTLEQVSRSDGDRTPPFWA